MNNLLEYAQASLNQFSPTLSKEIVILPAWIQGRVSTKQQVSDRVISNGNIRFEDKASLDEQKKKCINAILTYKGNCPVCYKELRLSYIGESLAKGESGRKQDREDIDEILTNANKNIFKIVVTIDNDRLARKRATAVFLRDKLKEQGVQIYSLSQPIPLKCPDCFDPLDDDTGVIVETLSDMKAQLDLSKIRRNYKIGMPRRIQNGKPTGSLAYGLVKTYKKIGTDSRGNDLLEEVFKWSDKHADIVKRITDEYLGGSGVRGICKRLNSEGVSSPQGKIWGRSSIIHILKNPVYAGKIRFGWKPVKNGKRKQTSQDKWMLTNAQFKGLWSWDHYQKIQYEMKRRKKVGGRAVASKALLIGLLKCSNCKYSMLSVKGGKVRSDGSEYIWKGYACGSFIHGGNCKHNGIKQDKLDEVVINEVIKLADHNTRQSFYDKLINSKGIDYSELLSKKQSSLSKLLREFDRINKAYREGIDTLEEYADKKGKLLPQIEALKNEEAVLKLKVKNPINLDWRDTYKEALNKFIEHPTDEDRKKVKNILNRLIERVEFRKKPISVKIFYRFN